MESTYGEIYKDIQQELRTKQSFKKRKTVPMNWRRIYANQIPSSFSRKSALKFVDQRMNMDDEGKHKTSKYIPWMIETLKQMSEIPQRRPGAEAPKAIREWQSKGAIGTQDGKSMKKGKGKHKSKDKGKGKDKQTSPKGKGKHKGRDKYTKGQGKTKE